MKKERQNVRYEFFPYNASGNVLNQTLVLNNPASVKFVMFGSSGTCTINNVYTLQGCTAVFNGTSNSPYELILENNSDEIDNTTYKISLDGITFGDANLIVICKYFVK